jgi:hypothetical protein
VGAQRQGGGIMKERPIIFNAEMVRAILDGRKTQTRRPIKWKRTRFTEIGERDDGSKWPWSEDPERACDFWHPCPFGAVGDQLWVRETFSCIGNEDGHPVDADGNLCDREGAQRIYRASAVQEPNNYGLWTSPDGFDFEGAWTPSIHMPRWASRITLEITGVRVERLNDISEEDARAEGVKLLRPGYWRHYQAGWTQHQLSARGSFVTLWKSIYGEESWNANPWVWVVEFQRMEGAA